MPLQPALLWVMDDNESMTFTGGYWDDCTFKTPRWVFDRCEYNLPTKYHKFTVKRWVCFVDLVCIYYEACNQ